MFEKSLWIKSAKTENYRTRVTCNGFMQMVHVAPSTLPNSPFIMDEEFPRKSAR